MNKIRKLGELGKDGGSNIVKWRNWNFRSNSSEFDQFPSNNITAKRIRVSIKNTCKNWLIDLTFYMHERRIIGGVTRGNFEYGFIRYTKCKFLLKTFFVCAIDSQKFKYRYYESPQILNPSLHKIIVY